MLGWPERYKLAHGFLCEYSYQSLKLAQLLGQLGVFFAYRVGGRVMTVPPCRGEQERAQGAPVGFGPSRITPVFYH
jgi:hypothetical protein